MKLLAQSNILLNGINALFLSSTTNLLTNLQRIAQDELVESLRRAVAAAESADIAKEMLRQQILFGASALLQDVVAAATAARDMTIALDFDSAVSPWNRRSSRSPQLRDGGELTVEKERRDAQNRDSLAESTCSSGTSSQTSRPPSPLLEMQNQEPEDALSTSEEETVKEDESENEEDASEEEGEEDDDEEDEMHRAGDAIDSGQQDLHNLQGHITHLIVARYCVPPPAVAKFAYTSVHTCEIYHKSVSKQLVLLYFGGSKSGLSNRQNLMT